MSPVILTPPPVPPPVDPSSGAPPTLTVTYYQQLVAHFFSVLDEITAALPRPDSTQQVRTPGFIRTHLNIPLVFLGSSLDAVEQLPELQAVNKVDPLEGRDTLQLIEAFRPLRNRVAAFELYLDNVLDARQVTLAVGALDTYDLVKSLARDKTNAPVAAANATLKRDLGRSGPKTKKVVVTPVPAPAPVPIPVPAPAPAPVPSPVSTTATSAKPEGLQG